jgi:hypothetical protein
MSNWELFLGCVDDPASGGRTRMVPDAMKRIAAYLCIFGTLPFPAEKGSAPPKRPGGVLGNSGAEPQRGQASALPLWLLYTSESIVQLNTLLTCFLTHPSRGDSLWPAFAGTGAGQGLLCRRHSHPSHPHEATQLGILGCQQHCFSAAPWNMPSITHSATPHLFIHPTHTRSLSKGEWVLY